MKCGYCFNDLDDAEHFFSSYVLYMVNISEHIPVFCDRDCMLRWVAIRTETPLDDIKHDFLNFCAIPG